MVIFQFISQNTRWGIASDYRQDLLAVILNLNFVFHFSLLFIFILFSFQHAILYKTWFYGHNKTCTCKMCRNNKRSMYLCVWGYAWQLNWKTVSVLHLQFCDGYYRSCKNGIRNEKEVLYFKLYEIIRNRTDRCFLYIPCVSFAHDYRNRPFCSPAFFVRLMTWWPEAFINNFFTYYKAWAQNFQYKMCTGTDKIV